MKKNVIKTIAAILLIIITGSLLYARPGEEERQKWEKHHDEKMNAVIKELGLSPEQEEQIKQQREANREKRHILREQLHAQRKLLRKQLEKPEIDRDNIYGIVAELKRLQGDMLDLHIESIIVMKKILTPEQFRQLQELKEKHHHEYKQRFREKTGFVGCVRSRW